MLPNLDMAVFFDHVRHDPFPGKLNEGQVIGMERFIREWRKTPFDDLRWLAYALGTQPIETGWTMHPVEEGGKGQGKKYGQTDPETGNTYYGRGYVQLTWRENYARATKRLTELGLAPGDLETQPHLATIPEIAAPIMAYGMAEGWFTGAKLADYFNDDFSDWRMARQIVNRMDRADEIAGHARAFHKALIAACDAGEPIPETPAEPAEPPIPSSDDLADLIARLKKLTGARTVRLEL